MAGHHLRLLTGHASRDHVGVDGFLDVIGRIVEITCGDLEVDQLFCLGTDGDPTGALVVGFDRHHESPHVEGRTRARE